jgi:hypothetical protein
METANAANTYRDIYSSSVVLFELRLLIDTPNMAEDTEEAPPEVQHYNSKGEVPWDIQK